MKLLNWLIGKFKKKFIVREKVRIRISNGKFVRATIPHWIKCSTGHYSMAQQWIACYEIQLNGNEFGGLCGLGNLRGFGGNRGL